MPHDLAGADIKPVEPLIKQFGPPESVKKTFYATLFGSPMGQTVVFLGLLAIYFAIAALLYTYAKAPLQAFRDDLGAPLFGAILAAPFACILLFAGLPTALRARRERRLKAKAIGGVPKPGYFRLQPYGAADHDAFTRLDGADENIFNWLTAAEVSLLYLSGASGVGKSSALAASVLPRLRAAGWAVVETRVFGDPVARVRAALLDAEGLFRRKPANAETRPLADLPKAAADARVKADAPPLLLVIDQFEEFLILHSEVGRRPFMALLHELANNPMAGLRLLLVFRSDYRPLIFKLGLPPLVPADNWQELAPYKSLEP